jgi:hypothetical protein
MNRRSEVGKNGGLSKKVIQHQLVSTENIVKGVFGSVKGVRKKK